MSEKRDWTTIISLTIVGASAAVTSFSAQADLAGKAGWPDWMSWLLPATDDVYGVAATRIWLSSNSSDEVRKHARAHAAGALLLSMAGNAMDHALSKGALRLGSSLWLLVVAVSLVPPIALGALMHLVTLRGRDQVSPNPVRSEGGRNPARGATSVRGHKETEGHQGANIEGPTLSMEAGANTVVAPKEVAPAETVVAPEPVAPAVSPPPVAPQSGPPVTPVADRAKVIDLAPRGEVQIKMRSHWDTCITVGQIPTGADLNRAASKDPKYSLGKKYARVWREELPAAFVEAVEDGRPDDAAEIARESAAGAGEGVGS